MRSYLDVEIEHGNNCQAGSEKIGFVESADFCNVSACQHADAYSHIPRSEVGGSGCAPLTVGGKVYEQCVVGRKHDAEAYAKQQCHCKEHDVACHAVPLDDIDACREQEETEYHDVQPCRNYLRYFPSVYNPAGKDARDSHAHRHESKEKAGSCMDTDFFGIHGYVVGSHSVRNG